MLLLLGQVVDGLANAAVIETVRVVHIVLYYALVSLNKVEVVASLWLLKHTRTSGHLGREAATLFAKATLGILHAYSTLVVVISFELATTSAKQVIRRAIFVKVDITWSKRIIVLFRVI